MQATMEVPKVPGIKYITLPDRDDYRVAYTLRTVSKNSDGEKIWVVFINGLGLPQAFWQPCIQVLEDNLISSPTSAKVITTTYDRYAQGESKVQIGTPKQHDLAGAADELEHVIANIHQLHNAELSNARIVLVAHSIGVPLTRLYLAKHTSLRDSIAGALFLDSNVANLDFVSVLPDPDSPAFDPSELPADTTVEELIWTRSNYERMFSPLARNTENLDRSTLSGLLPHAGQPKMQPRIALVVISHDPEAFAVESLKISTKGLTQQYIEPAWHAYNLGLLTLSGRHDVSSDDIVVARGAGHFVQRDNPSCVATEIYTMIVKIQQPPICEEEYPSQ